MECGCEHFSQAQLASLLAQQWEMAECGEHSLAVCYVPGTVLRILSAAGDGIKPLWQGIFAQCQ